MKRFLLVLITVAALSAVGTVPALAQPMDSCQASTIQSLQTCVQHAAAEGFITNQGVTQSLLAKLDAAQAAVDRNQPDVAVNLLEAFIQEVEAQAGQHIVADHAQHMVMHAQMVIEALTT